MFCRVSLILTLLSFASAFASAAVFNVRDYGAAGDGEVRVPAGHYVSGSVFLRSNVGFRIEGGTVKPTPLSEKTLGERNRMLETCTEVIW